MSSSPAPRMKIGDFLLRRLNEAGVRHLFGVPGDYNLELLQQLQDSGALKVRRQVAGDPGGRGRGPIRRRVRAHGVGRKDASSGSDHQHCQICDR